MKATRILLGWSVICLSLIAFGCSNSTGEAVTASDGVEISFDRRGEGKPTLIFVHGWANNRSVWDAQIAHFSRKYEVINVDLPGFGESGNNREKFTIASYSDDLATVIHEFNLEQAVLIGFSMGAPVVIEAATKIPESIIGVVLVESLHDVELEIPTSAFDDDARFMLDLVASPTNEELVSSGFYTKNQETSFQRVIAMLHGAPRAGWRESLLDSYRWQNEDCIELLKQLQVPVMAINTELRPTNSEAFLKYVPSFHAKTISDSGHLVMWDAPQEFNQLLEESIQELKSQ
jgi:pimeloyl-ACP methyl ester carboxylesterase